MYVYLNETNAYFVRNSILNPSPPPAAWCKCINGHTPECLCMYSHTYTSSGKWGGITEDILNAHIHTYTHTPARVCICIQTNTCTHTYTRTHTRPARVCMCNMYTYTQILTNTHTHIACAHIYIHTPSECVHMYTYTRPQNVYTCIHTHALRMCTYVYIHTPSGNWGGIVHDKVHAHTHTHANTPHTPASVCVYNVCSVYISIHTPMWCMYKYTHSVYVVCM